MKALINKNRFTFLLVALFVLSEILVNPLGEFPLNDDWSYTKSLLILTNEGRLDIGEWPAMTLVSHLVWGALFVKTAGFSFFILRFSTLLSSIIGLLVFFRILNHLTKNKVLAFIASVTLMVCPLYLNLSNTFMTDVNFNTLLILACYFTLRYYQTAQLLWVIPVVLTSSFLALMRQFGIIVPFCFLIGCFVMPGRKTLPIVGALVCMGLVYLVFHMYEIYLKSVLPSGASYKFAASMKLLESEFYTSVFTKIQERWKSVLITISIYIFPFTVAALGYYIKNTARGRLILCALFSLGFSLVILFDYPVQSGNIFLDMSVGAETFYQSLNDIYAGHRHTWSPAFIVILQIIKHLSVSVLLFVVSVLILGKHRPWKKYLTPFNVFIALLFGIYVGLLFVTDNYFDRYQIPAIMLSLIALSVCFSTIWWSWKPSILPLVLFAYVSIAGTRDYFTINRTRWLAYEQLREQAVSPTKINAGFEVNCWDEGNYTWWVDFLTTDNFDYLIQFRREPGFEAMQKFPFRRYFPFSMDTIGIYQRQKPLREKSK